MGMLIFLVILILAWQGFYWIGVDLLELWKPYAVPGLQKGLLNFAVTGLFLKQHLIHLCVVWQAM